MSERQKDIAQHLPAGEALLLDYLHKLERHRQGRRAVLVRLSALQPVNRRDQHIRIAISTFDPLIKQLKGQIFALSNADLMFIFKEGALHDVENVIVKLRFMFSEDPALSEEPAGRKTTFLDWFQLERDYDALLHLAQRLISEGDRRRTEETQTAAGARAPRRPQSRGNALTADMLARLEEALTGADLANVLRRQAVSAIIGNSDPQAVFYELFISIADLRETLLPSVNLASSPWLFQQLTETLDRRVLSLLNRHDDSTITGDISINLNVQTLLSPEFLVFDDNIKAATRGTQVLELQKVDIFADLGAFLFARDFAHDRGYRICIDGVNMESLPFVDRMKLGIDLVKIVWDPAMTAGTLPNGGLIEDYIRRCGPSRSILCRCDGQEAIDFGQSVGITLFQGRHVEQLLAASQKRSLYARRR
ncbi:MAG: EAL domain-containing protein [Telmatospirillum sp.]|nr:EAL domain-containing protein [Telmatospirillum sp.]